VFFHPCLATTRHLDHGKSHNRVRKHAQFKTPCLGIGVATTAICALHTFQLVRETRHQTLARTLLQETTTCSLPCAISFSAGCSSKVQHCPPAQAFESRTRLSSNVVRRVHYLCYFLFILITLVLDRQWKQLKSVLLVSGLHWTHPN